MYTYIVCINIYICINNSKLQIYTHSLQIYTHSPGFSPQHYFYISNKKHQVLIESSCSNLKSQKLASGAWAVAECYSAFLTYGKKQNQ